MNLAKTKEHLSGGLTRYHLICALEVLDFKPDIVLFASRINHQFPHYVPDRPDPEAIATNAFSLNWSNLKLCAFPPFSVMRTADDRGCTEDLRAPGLAYTIMVPHSSPLLKQNPVYLKARKDQTISRKNIRSGKG